MAILLGTPAFTPLATGQTVYENPPSYFQTHSGLGSPGSTNGPLASAAFFFPNGLDFNAAGELYVADTGNHTIRKITADGVVSTFAGGVGNPGAANGNGTAARFNSPRGVAVDGAGNVFVADTANHTIARITPAGEVTRFAGANGVGGSANGTGATARFLSPAGLAVDAANNLYVADLNNSTIRKITPLGEVTTIAGLAGGAGNTNGTGSTARFDHPMGVTVDTIGNIYVADTGNHTIRKITPAGVVSTVAGTPGQTGRIDAVGPAARFDRPTGIVVYGTDIFITDAGNHVLRKIDEIGSVTTLAGLPGTAGDQDGAGGTVRFSSPTGIAVGRRGHLYATDSNHKIRRQITAPVITHSFEAVGNTKAGDRLSMRIGVLSGTPATFQWSKNGNPISGATRDEWIIENVQASDAAVYSVQASNIAGTDSASRNISVYVAPGISSYSTPFYFTALAGRTDTPPIQSVSLSAPTALAADATGRLYVSEGETGLIRKFTPDGVFTTLAGPGIVASSLAVDRNGNVFVASSFTNVVRKITPAGVVSIFAGIENTSGNNDSATGAPRFFRPEGVATDSAGNVYVADRGNRTIRKITPTGVVTTLAGQAGSSGIDDGLGSAARFQDPRSIAVDASGVISVADGSRIRRITPAGNVTTLAGQVGVDGKNDGTGTAATFNEPRAIAVDRVGNVYVADTDNYLIRRITPAGVVTTIAGQAGFSLPANGLGVQARFGRLMGITVDPRGNLYVADQSNNVIRRSVVPPSIQVDPGNLTVLAGGTAAFRGTAETDYPVTYQWQKDGAPIPGATTNTLTLTQVQAANAGFYGLVASNVAGFATSTSSLTVTPNTAQSEYLFPTHFTTFSGSGTPGSTNGSAGSTSYGNSLADVAVDRDGNVFVADTGNHLIRKITPAGVSTTLAGLAGVAGSNEGTGSAARFNSPQGLGVDPAGNVYVADTLNHTIRRISTAGSVTTFAGSPNEAGSTNDIGTLARFRRPVGIAVDRNGNVLVSDTGNHIIRRIAPDGAVTTLAGTAGVEGSVNGQGNLARFKSPDRLAVDNAGNLYVADTLNHTIRKISPAGNVTTLAGLALVPGSADGAGSLARFHEPRGIAVDPAGNVFVSDTKNHTIRRIAPDGSVTTVAGLAGTAGDTNGLGSRANFAEPLGLAFDRSGGLYVADSINRKVRRSLTAPSFAQQPANQSVPAGASATFTASVSSDVTAALQWHRNGAALPGATGSTLALSNVQAADAGNYFLTATNSVGATNSNVATLSIVTANGTAPTLTTQPASQELAAGTAFSLSVSVAGTPPFIYQWYKDGLVITGATNPLYATASAQPTDTGSYNVMVTNSAGAAVSAAANIRIGAGPSILGSPATQTVNEGGEVTLSVAVGGTGPFTFQWLKNGTPIPGATQARLTLSAVQLFDVGAYSVIVRNLFGSLTSEAGSLTIVPAGPAARLANLSVRTLMTSGQVIIVGLAIEGGPRDVLIRAVGPGLGAFGVPQVMADPRIELYLGPSLTFANDDWPAALAPTFARAGAFAFTAGSRDAALQQNLSGSVSVQAHGTGPGVLLVEAYDLGSSSSPRLVNVSARNRVGAGDDILVAGFTVVGTGTKTLLIRAIGPGLAQFGVTGTLVDPQLDIFDSTGTRVNGNDNWPASIALTFSRVGAFALAAESRDAALVTALPPGSYTVQVRGANGGTGEGLVEIYEVP